ncbi:hypothetical protein CKO51_25860 [Rhodopirellula sp. SM50]|nr:glycosyltransferase family 2 protein [Rhodopirellula sp. SM50]PAY16604.1 hypothetical protein CKO51_25860 [Rhodopirellula sp. SM50]
MSQLDLVSVGLPCYNRPNDLDRALTQLRAQTFRNLEIIVADNASPDVRVLQIAESHALSDSRVKVFRHESNLGAVGNHQFVKDKASGKYFLWFHDDDEVPLDFIEICVRYLVGNPRAVLVGPGADRYLDGQYWLSYETWDSKGKSTYERLDRLVEDAFCSRYSRFEQYLNGLFVLDAAPGNVSPHFKSQFYHFFALAEQGEIIHAKELCLKKHTTHEELGKYAAGSTYKRIGVLCVFSDEHSECVQQCTPIACQVLAVVIKSKNLTLGQKLQLLSKASRLFVRYPIAHELNRFRFLRPVVKAAGVSWRPFWNPKSSGNTGVV